MNRPIFLGGNEEVMISRDGDTITIGVWLTYTELRTYRLPAAQLHDFTATRRSLEFTEGDSVYVVADNVYGYPQGAIVRVVKVDPDDNELPYKIDVNPDDSSEWRWVQASDLSLTPPPLPESGAA